MGFRELEDAREQEEDLEQLLLEDLHQSVVRATDWTTEVLVSQHRKSNILLNPNFQRRDAWTSRRKSQFIESLMLGFPIPQIVLAERQDGRFVVIDGKQRLLSIFGLYAHELPGKGHTPLRFAGLQVYHSLNGMTLRETEEDGRFGEVLRRLENQTLRTVVIRKWKHESLLYRIFLRLNTGSVKLSPQELRNALHPGPFAEFVDRASATSPGLRRILKNDAPDFRMRDAELFLRFIAFGRFLGQYRGNLKRLLDETTQVLNERWEELQPELLSEASLLDDCVDAAYVIFDDLAFRKYSPGERAVFNRAVFDVQAGLLREPAVRVAALEAAPAVRTAYKDLCSNDAEFLSSIESTTKSLTATRTRFVKWGEALSTAIGTAVEVPRVGS